LQAVLLPEAGLDGMKDAVLRQPLDRGHLGAVGLDREHRARLRRAPSIITARAALAGVAANVRAGQEQMLPQEMHEERVRLHAGLTKAAVDGDGNLCHASPHVWRKKDVKETAERP
jgi:hypothetical protein